MAGLRVQRHRVGDVVALADRQRGGRNENDRLIVVDHDGNVVHADAGVVRPVEATVWVSVTSSSLTALPSWGGT